jgi:hypothetical protein
MDGTTLTFESLVGIAEERTKEDRKAKTEVLYKHGDIVFLDPNDLQLTEWNPSQRTVITGSTKSAMWELIEGIIQLGMLMQLVAIDPCGNLIEGNRRVVAIDWIRRNVPQYKDLKVECVVRESKTRSPQEMYAIINSTRKAIGNANVLEIGFKCVGALKEKHKDKFLQFNRFMGGNEKALKFSRMGGSLDHWKRIQIIHSITGIDTYTVGVWLLNTKLMYKANKLAKRFDRETLISFITKNIAPRI